MVGRYCVPSGCTAHGGLLDGVRDSGAVREAVMVRCTTGWYDEWETGLLRR
jgi:hypothetical protein